MEFKSYTNARSFFQNCKDRLTLDELKLMLAKMEELQEDEFTLMGKMNVTELIIDIEHQMDLHTNKELLKYTLKRKTEPTKIRPIIVKQTEIPTTTNSLNLNFEDVTKIRDLARFVDRFLYKRVLEITNCNRSKTAKILGVTAKTVYNKIEIYNL